MYLSTSLLDCFLRYMRVRVMTFMLWVSKAACRSRKIPLWQARDACLPSSRFGGVPNLTFCRKMLLLRLREVDKLRQSDIGICH
jgi:hypothetical protein